MRNSSLPRTIDRRTILRAAGIGFALPMLESVGALSPPRTERPTATRFVAIGAALGFHTPALFPKRAGRDYDTTPLLEPLRAYRDRYTLSGSGPVRKVRQ